MRKVFLTFIVAAVLTLSLLGCASNVKVRSRTVHPNQVTVQHLLKDWQNYTVYFTGHGSGHPSAVLFDLKNDERVVIADRWWKVEKYEVLADLVDSIQRQVPIAYYYPKLLELLGPDNLRYAYVFTAWDHVPGNMIDHRTMQLFDLPLPPYLAIDGDRLRERKPR